MDGMVSVESVIFLNHSLGAEMRSGHSPHIQKRAVRVPEGYSEKYVSQGALDEYSAAKDRSCADIVIATRLPNSNSPVVLASKRSLDVPFGGYWWMQGGGVPGYQSTVDFVLDRAQKECGVRPKLRGIVGLFRTCAEDRVASTTNICFVGLADYRDLLPKINMDGDHIDAQLFDLKGLENLPAEERHWYPMLAFEQVLAAMQ